MRAPLPAAGLLALALAACSEPNTLDGSLGEVVDLGFDSVEVALSQRAVVITYLKASGGDGRNVAFKLVVNATAEELEPGVTLDLAPLRDGSPRASAGRAVADDPVRLYAPVTAGTFTLEALPEVGRPLSGEFRLVFGEGGDAGEGRNAFGTFEVEQVVAGE